MDLMVENPYESLLEQLKSGEVNELIVDQADFMTFREVWKTHEDRTKFVGEAGLKGKIIYRYLEENA